MSEINVAVVRARLDHAITELEGIQSLAGTLKDRGDAARAIITGALEGSESQEAADLVALAWTAGAQADEIIAGAMLTVEKIREYSARL